MKIITLDFETAYSDAYSLRKMSSVEYILDPRFCMMGVAIAEDNGTTRFLEHEAFKNYLLGINPAEATMISHNALFDMCIVAWRYHFIPAMMIDTMTMAAALIKHKTKSVSLDAVSKFLGVGEKGGVLNQVKNMMSPQAVKDSDLWLELAAYAINDCNITRSIFKALVPSFPKSELLVMDSVIRACVQPRFQLDRTILAEYGHEIKTNKAILLARIGMHMTVKDLMSGERFAEELRRLGVEPGMKTSLATGKETYAFAKTDDFMAELEEHDDPMVQALVAARLGFKSTSEETRAARFVSISRLWWPVPNVNGQPGMIDAHLFPVPLKLRWRAHSQTQWSLAPERAKLQAR